MQKEQIEQAMKDAMARVFRAARDSVSSTGDELIQARRDKEESYRHGRDSQAFEQAAEAKIKAANEILKPIEDAIQTARSFVNKNLLEQLKAETDPAKNLKLLSETNPGTNSGSQLAKQYIRDIKDAYIENLAELDGEFGVAALTRQAAAR